MSETNCELSLLEREFGKSNKPDGISDDIWNDILDFYESAREYRNKKGFGKTRYIFNDTQWSEIEDIHVVIKHTPFMIAFDVKGASFKVANRISWHFNGCSIEHKWFWFLNLLRYFRSHPDSRIPKWNLENDMKKMLSNEVKIRKWNPDKEEQERKELQMALDFMIENKIVNYHDDKRNFPYPNFPQFYSLNNVEIAEKEIIFQHFQKKVDPIPFDAPSIDRIDPITEEQKQSIKNILKTKNPFAFNTGFAGTGKTKVLSDIIKLLSDDFIRDHVAVVAPTNKAVKVLHNAVNVSLVGGKIETIAKFLHSQTVKDYRLVIVDEASMVDSVSLAGIIRKAPNAKIVLSGDMGQLSPVSAGSPFIDLFDIYFESDSDNIGMLTSIHRTDSETKDLYQLFDLARKAKNIHWSEWKKRFHPFENTENALTSIVDEWEKESATYGSHEVLIVTHTNDDVKRINGKIYNKLFNTIDFKPRNKWDWKEGVRVVFKDTDSELGYMKNEFGTVVEEWSEKNECILVKIDNTTTVVPIKNPNVELDLGYCSTVHKAQGSGFDSIIFYISSSSRNVDSKLTYTAFTRTRKNLVVFLPQTKQLLELKTSPKRRTFLS